MNNQQGKASSQQANNSQNRNFLIKMVIISLIAGLLGGVIAFCGATYVFNNIETSTSVPTGSNSGGITSTSKMSVKVNSQASKAFKAVKGSVVSVINMQKQRQNSSGLSGILGDFYGDSKSGSSSNKSNSNLETASEGSGVIYKKKGNAAYVVTNNHVVSGSNALEVILSNGKKLEARLVGKDVVTDLAVLKINGNYINKVANFGNSDNIQVGETALAIGSPLGSQYATSLTEGIISAKKRSVPVIDESTNQQTGNATVIQTDAAINPGNSGGPLINLAGQVIGINSMKLASDNNGTSVEGMGFAIPSNEVVSIINQLIVKGMVVRPSLGIKYIDLSNIPRNQQTSILKLPTSVSSGVVIMENPSSGMPASTAGLKKYDVITALGGKIISDDATLRDILYQHKIGDTVSITYYHNGTKKTTNVKLNKSKTQINQ